MNANKTYAPTIIVRIPADIPALEHDAIRAIIADVNVRLSSQRYTTPEFAVQQAAIALSASGVGACGYASSITSA